MSRPQQRDPFFPLCRYYADVQQRPSEAEKPAKQAVAIDAEELLREAEEQAGDDGGEQVLPCHLPCSDVTQQGSRGDGPSVQCSRYARQEPEA